jgi:hypothetical protein
VAEEEAEADPALPAGWTKVPDAEGYFYYFNSETGETSWTPPQSTTDTEQEVSELLGGFQTAWQELWDDAAQSFYFYNYETQETAWERPVGMGDAAVETVGSGTTGTSAVAEATTAADEARSAGASSFPLSSSSASSASASSASASASASEPAAAAPAAAAGAGAGASHQRSPSQAAAVTNKRVSKLAALRGSLVGGGSAGPGLGFSARQARGGAAMGALGEGADDEVDDPEDDAAGVPAGW